MLRVCHGCGLLFRRHTDAEHYYNQYKGVDSSTSQDTLREKLCNMQHGTYIYTHACDNKQTQHNTMPSYITRTIILIWFYFFLFFFFFFISFCIFFFSYIYFFFFWFFFLFSFLFVFFIFLLFFVSFLFLRSY